MLPLDQRGMRCGVAELHASSYAVNLACGNNGRSVLTPDQAHYIRQAQDLDSLSKRQMHENISGEERHFQGHAPVLPLAHGTITGKKIFNFVARQTLRGLFLLIGPDGQNEPIRMTGFEWQKILGQAGTLFSEGLAEPQSGCSFALITYRVMSFRTIY